MSKIYKKHKNLEKITKSSYRICRLRCCRARPPWCGWGWSFWARDEQLVVYYVIYAACSTRGTCWRSGAEIWSLWRSSRHWGAVSASGGWHRLRGGDSVTPQSPCEKRGRVAKRHRSTSPLFCLAGQGLLSLIFAYVVVIGLALNVFLKVIRLPKKNIDLESVLFKWFKFTSNIYISQFWSM